MLKERLTIYLENPENYFEEIVTYYSRDCVEAEDILLLANALAASGARFDSADLNTADIPSTGGPSSLTTLLCPLYLASSGYKVIKLGVPGRPAGGIDVLCQIRGYTADLDLLTLANVLKKSNYVHFNANDNFAPLDSKLFAYRKKCGKINVPNLAIASLLSKKIAVGIKNVGLDIRVWKSGNFGDSFVTAQKNSEKFVDVAKMAGIMAKCFLCDISQPLQPYIGRGEALVAIYEILNNNANEWLQEHNSYCFNISAALTETINQTHNRNLKELFSENLEVQGSTYNSFLNEIERVISEKHYDIYSSTSGYCYYDLDFIRGHIVNEQKANESKGLLFPDPCGYTLLKRPGDYVEAGEKIATYRTINTKSFKSAESIYYIKEKDFNIFQSEVLI